LGFKTPNEVFMQSLNRVALRVWIYETKQPYHYNIICKYIM
jgi:hypothetical protein